MSDFTDAILDGIDQSHDTYGVDAVYIFVSDSTTLDLTVVTDQPSSQTDPGAVILASHAIDFLVRTADLVKDGQVYVPRRGDRLFVGSGASGTTYEVLIPKWAMDCWTFNDRYQMRRRLFTKVAA